MQPLRHITQLTGLPNHRYWRSNLSGSATWWHQQKERGSTQATGQSKDLFEVLAKIIKLRPNMANDGGFVGMLNQLLANTQPGV